MATNESFKFRDMCKKFLLISIIVVGVSIFLQIFYIAGAFAAFDYDY
jgi:hypothetical protein